MISPVVLDLNALISDMERMLPRLLGEDIAIVLALNPELGLMKADQSQLEQVIMNLAVNARDAMPNGGKLEIRRRLRRPGGLRHRSWAGPGNHGQNL